MYRGKISGSDGHTAIANTLLTLLSFSDSESVLGMQCHSIWVLFSRRCILKKAPNLTTLLLMMMKTRSVDVCQGREREKEKEADFDELPSFLPSSNAQNQIELFLEHSLRKKGEGEPRRKCICCCHEKPERSP